MFNKEEFKLKFEFFLRCYYELSNSDVWDIVELQEYRLTAFKILWQTRYQKTNIEGIDNREQFESFCQLLSIGMEQLDAKIAYTIERTTTNDFFFIQKNMLIIETVNELASDIEELLK